MCIDFEYELEWNLKCGMCGKKPAVNLTEPTGEETISDYKALCERCATEYFGAAIVSDFAGTELYLKKYPDQIPVWR